MQRGMRRNKLPNWIDFFPLRFGWMASQEEEASSPACGHRRRRRRASQWSERRFQRGKEPTTCFAPPIRSRFSERGKFHFSFSALLYGVNLNYWLERRASGPTLCCSSAIDSRRRKSSEGKFKFSAPSVAPPKQRDRDLCVANWPPEAQQAANPDDSVSESHALEVFLFAFLPN